jgi:hypothetical protein
MIKGISILFIPLLILAGCTSTQDSFVHEGSFLEIVYAQPAENSVIFYNDDIFITINYSIGNYNESSQYFADAELVYNDSSFLVNGAKKLLNNSAGIINLTLHPSILYVSENNSYNIYPPYIFMITLNKNYKGINFITLANQTINYKG